MRGQGCSFFKLYGNSFEQQKFLLIYMGLKIKLACFGGVILHAALELNFILARIGENIRYSIASLDKST